MSSDKYSRIKGRIAEKNQGEGEIGLKGKSKNKDAVIRTESQIQEHRGRYKNRGVTDKNRKAERRVKRDRDKNTAAKTIRESRNTNGEAETRTERQRQLQYREQKPNGEAETRTEGRDIT